MIEARAKGSATGFVARLSSRARKLAEAAAENRRRAADPRRWRHARLLWPLLTRD